MDELIHDYQAIDFTLIVDAKRSKMQIYEAIAEALKINIGPTGMPEEQIIVQGGHVPIDYNDLR